MEKLELPEEIPSGLVFKLGVTLCTHPLEVSKTLIQVTKKSTGDFIYLTFPVALLGIRFCMFLGLPDLDLSLSHKGVERHEIIVAKKIYHKIKCLRLKSKTKDVPLWVRA